MEEILKGTTWTLVNYQSEDKNGGIIYPLGENAKGTIIFTYEEILAVQIMAIGDNRNISSEKLANMNTPAEQEMAKLGYHAYSGSFTIDEENAVLTTSVELSLIQDYVGSQQRRKARIEGDTLHLSNVDHPERKLVWQRVR